MTERVPFTEENAALAARLFNLAGHRQGTLADCMIAATAIRCEARLATTNRRDFAPFSAAGLVGLTPESWQPRAELGGQSLELR